MLKPKYILKIARISKPSHTLFVVQTDTPPISNRGRGNQSYRMASPNIALKRQREEFIMADDQPLEETGEGPKIKKSKAKTPSGPIFTLKKWNAVAMWSWDVECDTCAICRVQVMGKK